MTKIGVARLRNGMLMRLKGCIAQIRNMASESPYYPTSASEAKLLSQAAFMAEEAIRDWSRTTKLLTSRCQSTKKEKACPKKSL